MGDAERLHDLVRRAEAFLDAIATAAQTRREQGFRPSFFGYVTVPAEEYTAWQSQSLVLLKRVFGAENEYVAAFARSTTDIGSSDGVRAGLGILRAAIADLPSVRLAPSADGIDTLSVVTNICNRFHVVVRQLRERHDDRETLNVTDEYDVQDLMHALLHLHFQDIRPEEGTPSYAGGASRMDFLLKAERTVLEMKKTRPGLNARKLGEELIVDKSRYQAHPDCDTLICFVYDPDSIIANPRGVENDLNQDSPLKVRVLIRPA